MAVPDIVVLRIDGRLTHGQEQLWTKALGMNTAIVVNNSANEDSTQQTLMRAMVPKTIAMCFLSAQYTCNTIVKASPKQTISIVCETPENTFKLTVGGVPVKEINVSNIHYAPGREEVSKYIVLGGEDKAALRRLHDTYGIVSNIRTTVSGDDEAAKVDLNKRL